MKNINKKLFVFDLDGTLLSCSKKNTIPNNVRETIKMLKKNGHIVVISTGRPWRATKEIYESLDLNTIVVNYNGSFIHNPCNPNFIPYLSRVKLIHVIKVLETKEIKKISKNIAIEGPTHMQVEYNKNKKSGFTNTFLKQNEFVKVSSPIEWKKIKEEPIGILIEINKKYAPNIDRIKNWFNSRFGDFGEFSYWNGSDDMGPILEMTSRYGRKDIALRVIARYYKIDMNNVIAFGDGYNDAEMLKAAGVGVAMQNASEVVKGYANVVAEHSNKIGGISYFIDWYFNKDGIKKVKKTIYSIDDNSKEEVQIIQENGKDILKNVQKEEKE